MANVKHGVIRTDSMAGTVVGTHLVSVRFLGADGNTPAEIDNGCVVEVGDLIEGERELRKGLIPAADTALKDIAIIATPEVMYDERKKNLDEFVNPVGGNCRGYRMHEHDMFGLTAEALNIAEGVVPAVGYVVELMAGVKLNVAASATEGSTQVGVIDAIEKAGRYTYYVIRRV